MDIWAEVVVKFEDDDREYTVRIVGTGEVGTEDGLSISFASPLGQAIKGKKGWETAKMRHESWRKNVEVLLQDSLTGPSFELTDFMFSSFFYFVLVDV